MKTYELLSLDETGKAAFSHQSTHFIVSGTVMPEKLKSKIDTKMRRLKTKFFGDEDLVFHARDLFRQKGPFKILQDKKKEMQFWSEFISIVNNPEISFAFVITNKANAQRMSWEPKTILKRSYLKVLAEFARHLKQLDKCGRIVTESEPSQDSYLLYAHNRLQSLGLGDGSVSGNEYKNMVTSLSLVNKQNLDIDVQLSDTMALVASSWYEREILKSKKSLTKVEQMKKRLLARKLVDLKRPSSLTVLI